MRRSSATSARSGGSEGDEGAELDITARTVETVGARVRVVAKELNLQLVLGYDPVEFATTLEQPWAAPAERHGGGGAHRDDRRRCPPRPAATHGDRTAAEVPPRLTLEEIDHGFRRLFPPKRLGTGRTPARHHPG